jgi:7-carboxy-7-deazaguanine synthase
MSIREIVDAVIKYGCPKVTITGGEPLLQKEIMELLFQLWVNHITTSHGIAAITIETNGTIKLTTKAPPKYPISFPAGYGIHYVVDYKLPSAGLNPDQINKVKYTSLRDTDWIKFVIADRNDFDLAKQFIKEAPLQARLAMSCVHDFLAPKVLMDWILQDNLWNVTLNLQLHKYIGAP